MKPFPLTFALLSAAIFCLSDQMAIRLEAVPSVSLSADEVVRQAVVRNQQTASPQTRYFYDKTTVNEEMDDKGRIKERKEKLYQAKVESGWTHFKLVKVDGRQLSAGELRRQEDQEAENRQQFFASKDGGDNRENFLTPEITSKYTYRLLESQVVRGRPAYVIAFQPRAGLPVRKIADRLLNSVSGQVWIDQADFEIARAEVHLKNELSLWGGLVGVLRKLDFALERSRLEDGSWFAVASQGDFQGRKLWDSTHVKTRSECNNFRKAAPALRKG